LNEAFLVDAQERATPAIEQARVRVAEEGKLDAFNFEVIVPDDADEAWLTERLIAPLTYFCQSSGAVLPACAGVFVSFFAGGQVHCVLAAEVIAWACQRLGLGPDDLVARYGTRESESAARRAPGP